MSQSQKVPIINFNKPKKTKTEKKQEKIFQKHLVFQTCLNMFCRVHHAIHIIILFESASKIT